MAETKQAAAFATAAMMALAAGVATGQTPAQLAKPPVMQHEEPKAQIRRPTVLA